VLMFNKKKMMWAKERKGERERERERYMKS
jgi:hypothetical protein